MSMQQDIYAAGFESRPPMLNKENYVPWSYRLLRYAKSRPNGKLIHKSIINGPYVRRMIPKPGDTNRKVPMNETFHVQTDDELTEKELKQIEADDQAIQTILLGLSKDIYAAVDSCETAQEILLRVQQMMKGSNNGIQEKKAKLFNAWEMFTSNEGELIESYYHRFLKLINDLKLNKHFPEKIATDYTQLYDFLKYNQKRVDELKAERLTKTQGSLALMENSNNPYAIPAPHQDQPSFNQNYMQQPMPNLEDITNELIGVSRNANLNGNGNMVVARAEGNAAGHNGNQIRCYNCRGVGHFARNCTVRPRRRDAAYLQIQLLIAQKKEVGIQLQVEEFDLMAATTDLDEIGEEHDYENCDDNEIFNMFTQEEQYTELLKPIPEQHQVPQNDNNIISEVTSVEQGGETVEQHLVNFEETRALYDSLYQNLAIKVEKVKSVNRKLKETNADLTTELARFKNQKKCFEISQEKYDKLERCYQQSVYQEQCLSKKINALHLNTGKQIMSLKEQISDLNKQLSKEKSIVSFLLEEKKKLTSDFKTREDELLDKQIQLEKKIKELNNILVKTGQLIQTIHMLSPKPDSYYHTEQKMALGYKNPFYLKQAQKKQQSLYNGKVLLEKHDPPVVHDSEETLQLAQESREKMKQLNKEIKPANYTKINHLSGGFVSQTAKSRKELYFSNDSKMANVSKSISIPNEEFLDDTTPSVARKFLNEEAAKFVGDFKSLAKEADESLAKHKTLELEIKRLLRAVVSQDIMCVMQKTYVVDTSNLQTKLECTKERFENCIIKKENEYAKLWNDWYKKCDECKFDTISYDKAYKDMQRKIKRLQAQLGDLKGKSKDTSCVSDTLNPLS
nr:hypothetical protein [Tanacetum cinerariifolium]